MSSYLGRSTLDTYSQNRTNTDSFLRQSFNRKSNKNPLKKMTSNITGDTATTSGNSHSVLQRQSTNSGIKIMLRDRLRNNATFQTNDSSMINVTALNDNLKKQDTLPNLTESGHSSKRQQNSVMNLKRQNVIRVENNLRKSANLLRTSVKNKVRIVSGNVVEGHDRRNLQTATPRRMS